MDSGAPTPSAVVATSAAAPHPPAKVGPSVSLKAVHARQTALKRNDQTHVRREESKDPLLELPPRNYQYVSAKGAALYNEYRFGWSGKFVGEHPRIVEALKEILCTIVSFTCCEAYSTILKGVGWLQEKLASASRLPKQTRRGLRVEHAAGLLTR